MPFTIECPQCQRKLNVPETLLGRRVKCPSCGVEFEASETPSASAPPPAPAEEPGYGFAEEPVSAPPPRPEPLDFDEDYGVPRERRRPHRGATILTLGILGLVMSCCPLMGWILGGCAMSMGGTDLYEMAKGRMDRDGQGITQAGRILGIIAVIFASLAFLANCLLRMGNVNMR
jgi:hypothetical protein